MSKKIEIREGKNKIEANCKRINKYFFVTHFLLLSQP